MLGPLVPCDLTTHPARSPGLAPPASLITPHIHISSPSRVPPIVLVRPPGRTLHSLPVAPARAPHWTVMSPTRPISADHPCRVRTTSLVSTDRARAPQVRHTSLSPYFEVLDLFQYFLHLLPPPSGYSLGRVIRQTEWIETVVQSVGLIDELSSTTRGSTPAWTWTGRSPGLTLLDTL